MPGSPAKDPRPCTRTDPEIFFPDSTTPPAVVRVALDCCSRCPVRKECLDEALADHRHGIWGGTTEKERRQLRATGRARQLPNNLKQSRDRAERQAKVAKLAARGVPGTVIARRLGVQPYTVQRDLKVLAAQGGEVRASA